MNRKKVAVWMLVVFILMTSLAGCGSPANNQEPTEEAGGGNGAVTLEDVNKFLNESADLGPGSKANPVAVIPFKHIDGPKNEDTFYAFVDYKFKARNYIKYQVTYVSCTCRAPANNYWQTAFVELTLPESGKIEDAEIRTLSYDMDAEGHYIGGMWGDSNPIPDGASYDMFKEQYIPYFVDKSYGDLKELSTIDDIDLAAYQAGEGRQSYDIDTFTGSSVSANNIIRILQALFEFHATDEFFVGEGATSESAPATESEETPEAEEAEETTSEETTTEKPATTSKDVAVLPAPVDTSKSFKPDKDSDEIPCKEDSFAPGCSAINADNFIDYMGRDDVYYIDLRDFSDYLQRHFRNFEAVPFFALVFSPEAGEEGKPQLYGGTPKEPIPMYEESDELLEVLFPKDKTLMIICQSGGRVGMLMDILNARGWDMSKIYNIGGMAQYTDSKYSEYIVDTLEFTLDGSYNVEGLTPVQ